MPEIYSMGEIKFFNTFQISDCNVTQFEFE